MSPRSGLGGREGAELLAHLADYYLPSLRKQAAAALLGAWVDDPAVYEDHITRFTDNPGDNTAGVAEAARY